MIKKSKYKYIFGKRKDLEEVNWQHLKGNIFISPCQIKVTKISKRKKNPSDAFFQLCTETTIMIVFDKTVSVARSRFIVNSQTFLTRLGGAISSGRTLLWIFASLAAAFQVLHGSQKLSYKTNKLWFLHILCRRGFSFNIPPSGLQHQNY